MIRPIVIASLLAAPLTAAEIPAPEPADLLRFTNGNQIDGRFGGMDSGGIVTWNRSDVATPMPFQRDKLRQIVLRHGRPLSALDNPCHVTLVNGDRIPGRVVAMDDKNFTLETTLAGTLALPRDAVAVAAPNPFGGRLLYAGPFDETGWSQVHSSGEQLEFDGLNFEAPPGDADDEAGEAGEGDEAGPVPSWSHAGASWYSRKGNDAIVLDAGMPDRALLRFKLGWRSRPSIAVAFHADLERPEPAGKEDDGNEGKPRAQIRQNFGGTQNLARLFGSAYVLNFQSGYIHLQRTGFDDEGNPEAERVRVGSTSVRLPDTGESDFEIRCDRLEGTIAVHINGEFAVQWNTSDEVERGIARERPHRSNYQAPGGGLGFQVLGSSSAVRISDIIIAEWNGMTDSARSMESDQRDIVLLSNGTDRFSGRVEAIRDGQVEIDASYGPLKIPLEDIAEVHFARNDRRETGEAAASEIAVHFQPVGRISGVPLSAGDGRIRIDNRLAGEMDLDLAPAIILEFQSGGSFLDEWDEAP